MFSYQVIQQEKFGIEVFIWAVFYDRRMIDAGQRMGRVCAEIDAKRSLQTLTGKAA